LLLIQNILQFKCNDLIIESKNYNVIRYDGEQLKNCAPSDKNHNNYITPGLRYNLCSEAFKEFNSAPFDTVLNRKVSILLLTII
jgi:hypothetical protein